ncbi:MAG: DUF177 domain-containing protein [Eudoraea sp.]|nr:DUF177 domain-containing protein [Eudoraea sp.]
MMKHKEYDIPFSGLKEGIHRFKYNIENKFFDSFGYDEFNAANIDLELMLNKQATMLELDMSGKGTVNVQCDLTGESYDQPISSHLELVVKFGEEFNNEDDEILIIPHGEHQVNVAQYIYEMLVLAVPSKRIHPGVLDGTLESDILNKLEELQPKETIKNKDKTDPRWDALKNLLTDK